MLEDFEANAPVIALQLARATQDIRKLLSAN